MSVVLPPEFSVHTPLPSNFLFRVGAKVFGMRADRQTAIVAAIMPLYTQVLASHGIDNDYRVAFFTGQVCVESDNFCTTVEYASGAAYEGRHDLGNVQKGDGVRFKGRGLLQLTGRANYEEYGTLLTLPLVDHPEKAADPVIALTIACAFWQKHELSVLADAEDLEGITRKINGGLNGLAARSAATDRAFAALGYT